MKRIKLFAVVLTLVLALQGCASYDSINEKNGKMRDYTMAISTIVTMESAMGTKQSAVDQQVVVNNKGRKNMIYSVHTTATSTDSEKDEVVSEENSYLFFDECYYYSYPGVRYKNRTDYDLALANIENLTNVISFSEEEMIDVQLEESEKGEIRNFMVDYEDTSPFVKGVLENAAATFNGVKFSPTDVSASVTIDYNEIIARSFYISYEAATGESITVEIYVNYDEAKELDEPDEDDYVNIAG